MYLYFGGSFDPPHYSHMVILAHVYQTLRETANLSQSAIDNPKNYNQSAITACFLPTSRSPLKTESTIPKHRLAMLHLACDYLNTVALAKLNLIDPVHPNSATPFAVSEAEIWQPPPTYTIDTLTTLYKKHPHASLVFILGADSIASLNKWRAGDQLTKFVHLWVLPRNKLQTPEAILQLLPSHMRAQTTQTLTDLKTKSHGHIYIDTCQVAPFASSHIRQALLNHDKHLVQSALLPSIHDYIMTNKLYRDD